MSTLAGHGLVRRPEDLTAAWLTGVLAGSDLLEAGVVDRLVHRGTGGHRSDGGHRPGRLPHPTAEGTGARSVVAKFASADEQSRSTGLMTRAYEIEVGFYGEVAGAIRTRMPRCYHRQCEPDTGWFVLLLEDLAGAGAGRPAGRMRGGDGRRRRWWSWPASTARPGAGPTWPRWSGCSGAAPRPTSSWPTW